MMPSSSDRTVSMDMPSVWGQFPDQRHQHHQSENSYTTEGNAREQIRGGLQDA
jgi:hypothetical protein